MKRIMVLGAGRGQVNLIKAVKNYGHQAVVASIEGDYPGFAFADEKVYIDITDKHAVSRAVHDFNIDGVVTACLNTGIESLGFACEANGLSGLSAKAGEICADKLKMKSVFEKHGVSTAKFRPVASESELETAMDELAFPLVLKAVDLQGSKGIYICSDKDNLRNCYKKLQTETCKEYCIVEEFIDGCEISAEAFVSKGEILYILPCGDVTLKSDTAFVPGGHFVPCDIDEIIKTKVLEQAKKAIEAVKLDNCDVNFDFIVKGQEVYIIELSGRLGANCLPELVSNYFGVDVYKLIIDTALGENPKMYFEGTKKPGTHCYAEMITSKKSGTLKEIVNNNGDIDNLIDLTFFVSPGDEVRRFSNSRDCVGQVVVKGESLEECRKYVSQIKDNIEFVLE